MKAEHDVQDTQLKKEHEDRIIRMKTGHDVSVAQLKTKHEQAITIYKTKNESLDSSLASETSRLRHELNQKHEDYLSSQTSVQQLRDEVHQVSKALEIEKAEHEHDNNSMANSIKTIRDSHRAKICELEEAHSKIVRAHERCALGTKEQAILIHIRSNIWKTQPDYAALRTDTILSLAARLEKEVTTSRRRTWI